MHNVKGVIYLKLFFKRLVSATILCVLFTNILSTVALAAEFIYYGGGLKEPVIQIEERMSNNILGDCIDEWNATDTPIAFTEGKADSYCISGQWDDTWYGLYTPKDLEFIFFGRAGNFKIEMNRTQLVGKSETFWKSVLTHELGHAVCLGDNPSSGDLSIMNHDRNRNYLTWPTSDDVAGVNDAYK